MPRATQLDTEIFEEVRDLFRRNWKVGATVRLLGVQASGWADGEEQMDLLGEDRIAVVTVVGEVVVQRIFRSAVDGRRVVDRRLDRAPFLHTRPIREEKLVCENPA